MDPLKIFKDSIDLLDQVMPAPFVRATGGLMVIWAILFSFFKLIPAISTYDVYLHAATLIIFVIIVVVGLSIPKNKMAIPIMIGFVYGIISGFFAMLFGGIPYYLMNFQDVAVHDPIAKLIRMLFPAIFLGAFIGMLIGSLRGFPSFARRQEDETADDVEVDVEYFSKIFYMTMRTIVILGMLLIVIVFLSWILSKIIESFGSTFGGYEQGNIKIWQIQSIMIVYILLFVNISTRYFARLRGSGDVGGVFYPPFAYTTSVFAILICTGAPLLFLFHDEEFQVTEQRVVAHVVFYALALLAWILVSYGVGIAHRNPVLRIWKPLFQ